MGRQSFEYKGMAPSVALSAILAFTGAASAHPGVGGAHTHPGTVHENGIGADPDGDTNPATDTGAISIAGAGSETPDAGHRAVIRFEAPPDARNSGHGDQITDDYAEEFGVTFFPKVTRQICAGVRHFRYDSACTYEAAPSGEYAAVYRDNLNRPLIVEFERPVCIVTMATYPTGGKENEPFSVEIQGWTEDGAPLEKVRADFVWNRQTVRWRQKIGAYYLEDRAKKIAVNMRSRDGSTARDVLRFLLDDFAFVDEGCADALQRINAAGAPPKGPVLSLAQ
ncbi:MAG: hypothetical protein AAGA09_06800 [Pseudomonadota bacterium]